MERRKHPRNSAAVKVRLRSPNFECRGFVRDVSTRGVFVELDAGQINIPDRVLQLHFEIDTGEQVLSRRIKGRTVRHENDGLAIRFSEHDILCRAVIQELIYFMRLYHSEPLLITKAVHAARPAAG